MGKVQGPLLVVHGSLWCAVLTWVWAAWLRHLARYVIGGVAVSQGGGGRSWC